MHKPRGSRIRHRRGLSLAALMSAAVVIFSGAPGSAAPPPGGSGRHWTATPLSGTLVQGFKSATGRLAKSDAGLLHLRSSKPVHVMVKLDYDSLAAYRGGIPGYGATSPAVTGHGLDPASAGARRYQNYIGGVENRFRAALDTRVPGARAGGGLRTVYGGLAVTLPGDKVPDLLKLPGVAAVQEDAVASPLTDSSPGFIGAPAIYRQLGGSDSSGKGVIVGDLDSGAWPEHPSYKDSGRLPAPPATADGTPRQCDFGDNPLTPANDPYVCDHKLISGQPFLDTYNAVVGGEKFPDSARDSDGHGTHTSTTAAGSAVSHANPLGIDRGAIHGIAPAAHVAVYKVCGAQGCFQSDSVAAVQRAILDKVRVINYSISGGVDPYSDPVELAFLDAYAAGVLVAASAGNDGPGAGTVNHNGPWVTTVAASTQQRAFQSTVTLRAGGASLRLTGATITKGITSPLPVVLASAAPYGDPDCDTEAAPGTFTGKIVACRLLNRGRVMKGYNVFKGGAAGMLLYNNTLSQTMTDNHWLPTVHLEKPQADQLLAFLGGHAGTTATFPQGAKANGQGDVMTAFSSRGPGGDFLKPDVTAPGLQIMGGQTPVPDDPSLGPPGTLYQVIAGTSMSAPHVTGAAALLFALHPSWTPGQVKSALETTGKTSLVKHDRTTPADPFDLGGGRIDLTRAGDPGLTIDETAANYVASATDPLHRIDLNVPSVNAPVMPGAVMTTRTVKNVSGRTLTYRASGTTVKGASISVSPGTFSVKPGKTARLRITIAAPALANGQYFGRVDLRQRNGGHDLHLPVAFVRKQGVVSLSQTCTPSAIALNSGRSTCSVDIENTSLADAKVIAASHLDSRLRLTAVTGATKVGAHDVAVQADLARRQPDKPQIAPGATPAGYLPLDAFGISPTPIGDEQSINLTVPAYTFAGKTYTRLGVVSDGYTVAGGATPEDVAATPQTLPNPARPNGELAPFWTDLDGTGAPGVYTASLTDGTNDWVVIEWRLNVFGTNSQRVFQQWIGLNGAEDISYAYDPGNLPAAPPAGYGLTVGAENDEGTAGSQISGTPTEDLRVTSVPGAPGGSLKYSFTLKGTGRGTGPVTTLVSTPLVRGVTAEVDNITVN